MLPPSPVIVSLGSHTADKEDLRVACFLLVRLDSMDLFFFFSHLTSCPVPFLTSLLALALTGVISAKQAPGRAPSNPAARR